MLKTFNLSRKIYMQKYKLVKYKGTVDKFYIDLLDQAMDSYIQKKMEQIDNRVN